MSATGMREVAIGEVIAGHNFVLFECNHCHSLTLLTPAGGSLRDCPPSCDRGERPDFTLRRFLLQGGECALVGEDQLGRIVGLDPHSPEDAEPDGEWETA